MPRHPRVIHAGELYHVYARGNGRATIYHEIGHRLTFLRLLGEILPEAGTGILAYCLMDNHFHLVLRAGPIPLSRPMQRLLSTYARTLNREAGRSGHVFERRFQSRHVVDDAYGRALLRYVHFNPVRAGIVSEPAAYRWSSHEAYLGGAAPTWLDLSGLTMLFGGTPAGARRRYLAYCRESPDAPHPEAARATSENVPLPTENAHFEGKHHPCAEPPPWRRPADLEAVVAAAADASGLAREELLHGRSRRAARARGMAARAIQHTPGLVLSDLARLTGLHVSALSTAGQRTTGYSRRSPELAGMWQALADALDLP